MDAVEIADDIQLPQFDLLNATTMKCDARKYKTGKERSHVLFLQTVLAIVLLLFSVSSRICIA